MNSIFVDIDYKVKQKELISTEIDSLVLSVAYYRYRTDSSNYYIENFYDAKIVSSVTDEDYSTANRIRDYYSKKIMWWKLSGKHLSKFRSDLAEFLSEDNCRSFDKSICGLIWKLPEFYFYDVELDRLFESRQNYPVIVSGAQDSEFTVKFLTKLSRKTRFNDVIKYWFINKDGVIVNFTIDRKNILLPMFESIVTSGKFLKLTSKSAKVATYDSNQYWNITALNSVCFDSCQ